MVLYRHQVELAPVVRVFRVEAGASRRHFVATPRYI
jgi:hypothetical protein